MSYELFSQDNQDSFWEWITVFGTNILNINYYIRGTINICEVFHNLNCPEYGHFSKIHQRKMFISEFSYFCSSLTKVYKPIVYAVWKTISVGCENPRWRCRIFCICIIFRNTWLLYFPWNVSLESQVLMGISAFKLAGNKKGPEKIHLFFDGYQNLTPSPSTPKELNPRPQVERGNTVCWWSTHWATIPLQNNKERHKPVFCVPPVHHAHHGRSTGCAFLSFNSETGMRNTPVSLSSHCAVFISSLVLLPHCLESKFYFLVRPSL